MAERAACLVDVYDTIITCDFAAHRTEMPQLAGVAPEVWHDMYPRIGATLTVGQLSKAEFFEVMLPGRVPVLAAAAVLVGAAVVASLMPAARAARVDVLQALRSE